jgi:hypothetical protein
MALPLKPFYPHRQNGDGSYDTICPRCFATVAQAKTEAELLTFDEPHDCDITNLWYRGKMVDR